MEELGYRIANNKGQPVISSKNIESAVVRRVLLLISYPEIIGPQQTRIAQVELSDINDSGATSQVGVVTPDESRQRAV